MKNILFSFFIISGFALSAHATPTGCNGWSDYCTDFSGQDHPSVELRMCDNEILIANGKEYDPVNASTWRSSDGNTIQEGNASNNWGMIFSGPGGTWSESCSPQD